MKINFAIITILSIAVTHSAFSQSTTPDIYTRSVGIDATFINNFIPLENQIGNNSEYLFHYLSYYENETFVKHALDFSISGNNEDDNSKREISNSRFELEYKIGIGKRKNAFHNFYVTYSTDLTLDYFYNKRDVTPSLEGTNTNKDKIYSFSLGPGFGLGYMINKRVSVYTEMGFYYKIEFRIDTFESATNSTSDFTDKETRHGTNVILPSSIILFYHF